MSLSQDPAPLSPPAAPGDPRLTDARDTGRWSASELRRLTALIWPGQLLVVAGIIAANSQPQIAQHFHTTQIAWFSLAFTLATIVATPFAVRLGDMYGKRRVMLALAAAGLVGDLVTVAAPNYPVMVIGRVIGGLYGPVAVLVLAAVRDLFPPRKVAVALGTVAGSVGVLSMLAPLLSGWLLDAFGWRGALWFLVASTVVAILALLAVPETPRRAVAERLDRSGALLLGGGLALVVFGVGQGRDWGWTSAAVIASFLGGLTALAVFVTVELRVANPILDLRMLGRRSLATVLLGSSVPQAAFFASQAILIFLALFPPIPHVSDGLGWSTTHNAVLGIPAGIITFAAGIGVGRAVRTVSPRSVWYMGLGVLATGLVLAGLYHHDAAQIVLTGLVMGLGGGILMAGQQAMIVSVVSAEEQAAANGLSSLLTQVFLALTNQALYTVLAADSTVFHGTAFYHDAAFTHAYLTMAAVVVLGLLISLAIPRLGRPADTAAHDLATPPTTARTA
ncbi:MFS transporter [Streptomyces humi]|uniref:MFS transporter n=1 Tax=Streptomyces humi TaxID=1428620 RepID=UPI00069C3138|nr:MFS transporter [Streptomyces humi]